jgi:hypothetical protein
MQAFLIWSGPASHRAAQAFHRFLGDVVQSVAPFLSSADISAGGRWIVDVAERLCESNVGIAFLTRANLQSLWMNYEAGCLSKAWHEGRVMTLLLGVQVSDVSGPLSQFQHTNADRDGIFKLAQDLNSSVPEERRLPLDRLTRTFDRHWHSLEEDLLRAIKESEAESADDRETSGALRALTSEVRKLGTEVRELRGKIEDLPRQEPGSKVSKC